MSIKIQCVHCQSNLTVNDKMAGKRGKCPKCGQVISIPAADDDLQLEDPLEAPAEAPASGGAGSGWGANARSPLDDLLDEAGVKAATTGPNCPSCGAEVQPDSVLCVECGFNFAAGRQMKTQVGYDDEVRLAGMSENEKIMAKAERDIQESPIEVEEGSHGDGADSFLIALGMGVVFVIVVAVGIFIVFVMDKVTTDSRMSWVISSGICSLLTFVAWVWLLIISFREGVGHGIGCFLCCIYQWYYAGTRGLWTPLALSVIGNVGGFVSNLVLSSME
jgi:hypothetical protein